MAETQVNNQVCGGCGSEVRRHSIFCFHCGGALQADEDVQENEKTEEQEPSDVWFREEITESKEDSPAKEKLEQETVEPKLEESEHEAEEESKVQISAKPFEKKLKKKSRRKRRKHHPIDIKETESEVPEQKVEIKEKVETHEAKTKVTQKVAVKTGQKEKLKDPKLKSAAALRNRKKPSRLKKVEIVWEEKDGSPNIWFLVITLILAVIAGLLIFLAFYLK